MFNHESRTFAVRAGKIKNSRAIMSCDFSLSTSNPSNCLLMSFPHKCSLSIRADDVPRVGDPSLKEHIIKVFFYKKSGVATQNLLSNFDFISEKLIVTLWTISGRCSSWTSSTSPLLSTPRGFFLNKSVVLSNINNSEYPVYESFIYGLCQNITSFFFLLLFSSYMSEKLLSAMADFCSSEDNPVWS